MNTKHTPGPWRNSNLAILQSESGAPLAQVRLPLGNPVLATEVGEANARLIAAAPDLIAALVSIRNQLSSGNAVASDISHAVEIARAAIAKAEGKQ